MTEKQGREGTLEAQKLVDHLLENARAEPANPLVVEIPWICEQLKLQAVQHVKSFGGHNPNLIWLRRLTRAVVALEGWLHAQLRKGEDER